MTDKQKYLVKNSLYHWVEAETEQEALDEAHTVTKIVEEEITGSHPNNRESIILNPNDPFFKL